MQPSTLEFLWRNPSLTRRYRTGVCLHGHTMYSQECLSFLPRYLHYVPGGSHYLRRYQGPRAGARAVDFSRAYWTPPLSPAAALAVEREQIERLELLPLVSLTDHDDIRAGTALQITAGRREIPVSLEWTVPYAGSFFHLGVHNLPEGGERAWVELMAGYTAAPHEGRLKDLLASLSASPETLIVLNHPFWLEEGITASVHERALDGLLRETLGWLHAFELNGTRSWRENAATVALAGRHSRPLISGGDRHACEPGACINLTNARGMAEFVAEVRAGHSTVAFLPHYREPMALRILEASWDILRPYPEYPGRERWIDRFYYTGEDGVARSLAATWKDEVPRILNGATGMVGFFATAKWRSTLRMLLMNRGELLR